MFFPCQEIVWRWLLAVCILTVSARCESEETMPSLPDPNAYREEIVTAEDHE